MYVFMEQTVKQICNDDLCQTSEFCSIYLSVCLCLNGWKIDSCFKCHWSIQSVVAAGVQNE